MKREGTVAEMVRWAIALGVLAGLMGCAGESADYARTPVDGTWTCPLGGTLEVGDGTYSTPAGAGTYAVAGSSVTFTPGLDGFCQLAGGEFAFAVASSGAGAELWLHAAGQAVGLQGAQ